MEYHFSHRVLFFLSSMLFDKLTPERQSLQKKCIDKIVNGLLRQIEKMPEKLFLTGSEELQRTWQVYGLSDFYRQLAIKEGTM